MKSHFLIFISLTFFSSALFSQVPEIEWQKSLGGSEADAAHAVQQTLDGGYIIAGNVLSNDGDVSVNQGNNDFWIVKLDALGNTEWQKSLGGSGDDYAFAIQQTTDSGFVLAGFSNSNDGDISGNHGGNDYVIMKLDNAGNLLWEKSLGGSGEDLAVSIQQTPDTGYIILGHSNSIDGDVTGNHGSDDFWLVKLNSSGELQWEKSFGGSAFDLGSDVINTVDGGYILAGYTASDDFDITNFYGAADDWIVKLDSSGNIQWQKSFGGSSIENANSIQQTGDNGYIISGYSQSNDGMVTGNHGLDDCWIIKLDSDGNLEWQKSLGGSSIEWALSVQQTFDGGFVAAGFTQSNDGDVTGNHGLLDFWIIKLDEDGNLIWQKPMGGTNSDNGWSIQQTADSGFILAGTATSNDDEVTGNHGSNDYWVVKLGSEPTGIGSNLLLPIFDFSTFPNPANTSLNVNYSLQQPALFTIELFNYTGEKIKTILSGSQLAGTGSVVFNISDFPPGIYLLKFSSADRSVARKLVIE